jgi:hypothetical protein
MWHIKKEMAEIYFKPRTFKKTLKIRKRIGRKKTR